MKLNSEFPILRGLMIFQVLLVALGIATVAGVYVYSNKLETSAALRKSQNDIRSNINSVGEQWVAWQELGLRDALRADLEAFVIRHGLERAEIVKGNSSSLKSNEMLFEIDVGGEHQWAVAVTTPSRRFSVKELSASLELKALVLFVLIFIFILVLSQRYILNRIHAPLMALSKLLRVKGDFTPGDLLKIKAEGEMSAFAFEIAEIMKSNTLLKARAAKNEIARQVAHDIRSPLTALLSLSKTNLDSPEQKQLLEAVIKRITSIADDLLTKSREESGDMGPGKSINEIIKEIVAEKRIEFSTLENISISEVVDENRRAVLCGGAVDIKRVLSNLINNSVEATVNENRIHVSAMVSHSQTQIMISDLGAGIPEAILEKLNAEVAEPVTTKKSGNGMGIASAKSAIRSCGGSMTIRSRLGEGTLIDIRLPTELRA
jgi:signal transduction histidine kinase